MKLLYTKRSPYARKVRVIALEKNNVDAIAAYVAILGEVLLAIPNEQHPSILSQLLLSTNNEGVTGPFRAYQKNNLSVVNACMQSLIACRNVNSGTFFKQFANEKSKYKEQAMKLYELLSVNQ